MGYAVAFATRPPMLHRALCSLVAALAWMARWELIMAAMKVAMPYLREGRALVGTGVTSSLDSGVAYSKRALESLINALRRKANLGKMWDSLAPSDGKQKEQLKPCPPKWYQN